MPSDKTSSREKNIKVFAEEYDQKVECPWCKSDNTKVISPFGGTVSEVLFSCNSCKNTFGWMKWQHKIPE